MIFLRILAYLETLDGPAKVVPCVSPNGPTGPGKPNRKAHVNNKSALQTGNLFGGPEPHPKAMGLAIFKIL